MKKDVIETSTSPALIYRYLMDHAQNKIVDQDKIVDQVILVNLDIIMDFHWFFLHSKEAKENSNDIGHVIAISYNLIVSIERCRDHYFCERCPERYHLGFKTPYEAFKEATGLNVENLMGYALIT